MKDIILSRVDDLVSSFVYYDRKEDEELPLSAIEKALIAGEISVEEIEAQFSKSLRSSMEERFRWTSLRS
jgi:hypothetical protein